ncbi:DNA polymerase IV [Candidatus Micrarchaeota archaeon]|nr:DNA polymerase IV [Candidatus Micrarchaeota archaeon]
MQATVFAPGSATLNNARPTGTARFDQTQTEKATMELPKAKSVAPAASMAFPKQSDGKDTPRGHTKNASTTGHNYEPIIAHLDMDCFFAQVEQVRRPELAGLPVVVGADPRHGHGRGVVCTANYVARKFGIKSAIPISQAYRLCPDAIFLPVDYRHYSAVSRHIFQIASEFAKTEKTGIDEGYLDLSGTDGARTIGTFTAAEQTARQIKAAILDKTGLTCSIGIAWNKGIAKMAAGMQKPNGLTVVKQHELQAKIWPLPAEALMGVGPQNKIRLNHANITTIGQIARSKPRVLAELLGSWGLSLHAAAWGHGSVQLGGFWQPKSISRETTFGTDTNNWVDLRATLDELCNRVHSDAIAENVWFKTVGVKIRFDNFETHTRAKSIKTTQALESVRTVAKDSIWPALESGRKVRLVGVRLSGLVDGSGQKKLGEFK